MAEARAEEDWRTAKVINLEKQRARIMATANSNAMMSGVAVGMPGVHQLLARIHVPRVDQTKAVGLLRPKFLRFSDINTSIK